MIIEMITLGSLLSIGYKNWKKQEAQNNLALLEKQRTTLNVVKNEDSKTDLFETQETTTELKSIVLKKEQQRNFTSASIAVVLAGSAIFYAPLGFISIPFTIYAGRKTFIVSWELAKKGKVDVETLVAGSIFGVILTKYFLISSLLMLLHKTSEVLTSKVLSDSRQNLSNIFQQSPATVWMWSEEHQIEISIPLQKVKAKDILVVHAGEVIPADGFVVSGMAGIDQHALTGEAMPVEKGVGEEVFAMTLVTSGKIHFKVEKSCHESTAAKIIATLNHTADYKSQTSLQAEFFARQMVNPTLMASAVAFPLIGFSSAVSILLNHPKYRFSIVAPISLLKHLKNATEKGILIKDGRSLELLNKVDTLVFDKTGTLTEEQPHIGTIHCFVDYNANQLLYFATIAEHKQTHPLAKAILAEAQKRGLQESAPDYSEYRVGYGVSVTINSQKILVGSTRFMEMEDIALPTAAQALLAQNKAKGFALVMITVNGQLAGAIELLPTIRPEAKQIIQQLKQRKNIKHTYIISGDSNAPTQLLAEELGIDHYFANTLPDQKAKIIAQLQQKNHFICYIGDGINDSIALKQAQVSVSFADASKVATDTAQIVLLDSGIEHLPTMFEMATEFDNHMKHQLKIILGISICGVSGVFLAGWGVAQIMGLNIVSLATTLGYSLSHKPKAGDD